MGRIVVNIYDNLNGHEFYLQEACGTFPQSGKLYPFNAQPDQSMQDLTSGMLHPAKVSDAGQCLYRRLTAHPAVKHALNTAQATGMSPCPIYIQLMSDDAEGLPWETLCDRAGEFFTLDLRWPIGRIASSTLPNYDEYAFEQPLRIMAILSAAGIDARPEWDALYNAITSSNLKVKLRVMAGQAALINHIKTVSDPNIDLEAVELIPNRAQDVEDKIEAFLPNIIHFFCHGSTAGDPHLQVATAADHARSDGKSRVQLSTTSLSQIPNINKHTWLIVLNSCQGATPTQNAHSLARSLVTNGFPVVVGMRETVASSDANIFCESFYKSMFGELKAFASSNDPATTICWANKLSKARKSLGQRHAGTQPIKQAAVALKEWTLPVLYVQPAPFRLRKPATNNQLNKAEREAKQIQLSEQRKMLKMLLKLPDVPPEYIEDIVQGIEALEQEIYPL